MTQVEVKKEETIISGIWKFQGLPVEEVGKVAQELLATEPSAYRSMQVRKCSKNQYGISFVYDCGTNAHDKTIYDEFFDRMTDSLKRRFGNDFAGWDVTNEVWTLNTRAPKTPPTVTMKEVYHGRDEYFSMLLREDQLDLKHMKLEEEPRMPDLDLVLQVNDGHWYFLAFLLLDPDGLGKKKIEFELTIPFSCIPDAMISVQDLLDQGGDVPLTFRDTIVLLVKREARLGVERRTDDVKLTLVIGKFETDASCELTDLKGFVAPVLE